MEEEPSDVQDSSQPWQSLLGNIYSQNQHQEQENDFRTNVCPTAEVKARLQLVEEHMLHWFVWRRTSHPHPHPRAQRLRRSFRPMSGIHIRDYWHWGGPLCSQRVHRELLRYHRSVRQEILRQMATSHMLLSTRLRGSARPEDWVWPPGSDRPGNKEDLVPPDLPTALDALQRLSVSDTAP